MNTITCPHCNGSGMEFPDCETCEGRGWVDDPSDGGTMSCPECYGETCSVCNGELYIDDEQA
jgi:DnaJ-class molecular chaperone